MKLADIVDHVIIDPGKLTRYALDTNSPYGQHKAIVFEKALGFTKESYDDLLEQLEAKALETEAIFHSEDKFGQRYTVDILIEGVRGQQAIVRTGWLVSPEQNQAHLVTLYVKKDKR